MFRTFTLALTLLTGLGEPSGVSRRVFNEPGSLRSTARQNDAPAPKPDKPAPVAAKTVSIKADGSLAEAAAVITKQTGIAFDLTGVDEKARVNANFGDAPAWKVIEAVANQANCFVRVAGSTMKLTTRPNGVGAVPSGIDGPFRVVLKKVIARRDPESADAECEVHLEVQWEPRFPVLMIDTEPKATATAGKQKLVADAASVRVIPSGYSHPAVVRLKNVPRDAKQLDDLTCTFRVVAAAKMLAVEFKDLTTDKPVSQTVDGVKVTLDPPKAGDKRVDFRVACEYPDGQPEFESFQLWHAANPFRLYPPNATGGVKPSGVNVSEGGRRFWTEHQFARPADGPLDLKGWRAVYETPGPMREQAVTVTLKAVVLP